MVDLLETLVNEHLITDEQLADARQKQLGAKKPIISLLLEMDSIAEENMLLVASRVFNMAVLDLDKEMIDPAAAKLVPYETASRHCVFPLRCDLSGCLVTATSDPRDIMAADDLKFASQREIRFALASPNQIKRYIQKFYNADDLVYELLKNYAGNSPELGAEELLAPGWAVNVDDVQSRHSPAVRLVNILLGDAVKNRASDIHIEPKQHAVQIRYRIDGDLREIMELPSSILPSLVKRIKIISSIDISEMRKPHDGRTSISIAGTSIDLRVATVPTVHGERVELRILDAREAKVEIGKIGFEPEEMAVFLEAIKKPKGMILITGPTGAGKNSTIYAALSEIKHELKSIISIEDPVEYLIDGINQIQVNPVKDVTFANGLRSILRQDPDIISVGEIRDGETAEIAFRASLTGHLVLSTLHTVNTASAVTRLLDIGLEPYLISSALLLVVSQRLVKRICPACKKETTLDPGLWRTFEETFERLGVKHFYKGGGCARCNYSGYYGRIAIFEIMPVSAAIRGLITTAFSEDAVARQAQREGVRSLAESGIIRAARGITTIEEVARVAEFSGVGPVMRKESTGTQKRVAIADDDEISLKLLSMSLSKAGFDVCKLRDGEELVAYAIREKPDLIITDVTMPKMNGFEAVAALKSNLETALIPVMLLTAREDKDSELKGLNAGADDYLTKPFDHDKLAARCKMLLRRG